MRNPPNWVVIVNRDPDIAALLERFHVGIDDVPVVICRGEQVLKNPGNEEVAACLRMNPQIDDEVVRDLVVGGAHGRFRWSQSAPESRVGTSGS